MAQNVELTNRVREALQHVDGVEEKKMFRGTAFMLNGKMCISTGDTRLMCRVNPALHNELVLSKKCEVMKMKGREYKGYFYIQEADIAAQKEFVFWINLALNFNRELLAKKKK
jgi:hypothetical protein